MRFDIGAFRLDGEEITVGEVLAACLAGGSLAPLLQQSAARAAGAEAAARRGLEVGEDEIQAAFDAWRQDRDLIAAEEFDAWLERFGVTLEDVAAYLERSLLGDMLGHVDDELGDEGSMPETQDLVVLTAEEALLGGRLRGLTEEFALRACAPDPPASAEARVTEARRWMLAEAGFADEEAFVGTVESFEVPPERARWALDREVAFRIHQQEVLTQEALREAMAHLRDDLVRYELQTAVFHDDDVAREVACCIREDKDSFSRASARAGETPHKRLWLHVDVEHAPFGARLASTKVREILGPQGEPDGRALLGQLRATLEPDLSDPEVLARVERRIVERSLRHSMQQRVMFPPSLLGGG